MMLMGSQASAIGEGRLLGSGGLSSIDGAAGGGLVPWAVIGGHGDRGEWDVLAALTYVDTGDFDLKVGAVTAGWNDRLELSAARLSLGLDGLVRRGQFPDRRLDADVFGAKLRIAGDLIYGDWPQISAGLQWRRSRDAHLVEALGADERAGIDAYLAASRLFINGIGGYRTLANVTLRSSNAHQLGLLGFSDRRSLDLEAILAVFLTRSMAIGVEYRGKPDRLALAVEEPWMDLFVAWFPSKRWHWALAYVDLGSVGGLDRQRGYYLSLKGSP